MAELAVSKIIREKYTTRGIATDSQIDRFLEDTSKRLLCTVVLGSMNIGDETLRDGLRETFQIRNDIVHGKRNYAKKIEAENGLERADTIIKILRR